jgi:phosphatidate phosphatase APP1
MYERAFVLKKIANNIPQGSLMLATFSNVPQNIINACNIP